MLKRFLLLFPVLFLCLLKYARCDSPSGIEQYETIVQTIKDNPKQAITDLHKLVDKNNSAAMEYLILLSIYEPNRVNTPEFEKIAERLHLDITAQYEKAVQEQAFYNIYKDIYSDLINNDYLGCYKNLKCLIQVGAYAFSKFFDIWENQSIYALYVPWKIVVPCPIAQKLHLTAIEDGAGGGHGAETLDISNCHLYNEYDFPADVEEYRDYIWKKLPLTSSGTIRFVYYAMEIYENIRHHYDPDWFFEDFHQTENFTNALPLEKWAMQSYPNYLDFNEIINHGIGFKAAVEKLTKHYVKTFNINEEIAQRYAYYVLTPWTAQDKSVDKELLRYKILSGSPGKEIKQMLQTANTFPDAQLFDTSDTILMTSIHRPDILKTLIEDCPMVGDFSKCIGLDTNVNAKNSFGKTALMYAAQYGFKDSVKILLDSGADINTQTNEGNLEDFCWNDICVISGERTALMYAVQEGHLDIARYLVERGANIDLKDTKGMTVYDYLSGKAPYLGNYKRHITIFDENHTPPETYENKNVSSQQAEDFVKFLKQYNKEK